jgi:hypothetical protein
MLEACGLLSYQNLRAGSWSDHPREQYNHEPIWVRPGVVCGRISSWQTAGMFGEAAMAEPWDGVGEAAMAEPTRHERGLLGGCDAHTGSETSVGTLQPR